MPYEFLDDAPTADVGFVATGASLNECFRAAADATLASMVANPGSVQSRERREAHVEHEDRELALLRFLEEIVYYKDAESLFLRAADVRVREIDGRWRVDAVLEGEAIDASRHQLTGDVKAVTVHRLRVERVDAVWRATVILDV